MELTAILLILSGLFVGWTIGANDAANCFGTSVGAGLIEDKRAIRIIAVLSAIGAILQGGKTINTIGKGIVNASLLNITSLIAALLAAALLVTYMTIRGLPASTTQAVVGGIAGTALIKGISTNWLIVGKIFVCGFLTVIISLIMSFVIYKVYYRFIESKKFLFIERVLRLILVASGAFLAYSLGANNIGNAVGLIVGKGLLNAFSAGVLGGLAISFGSLTLGKKVMKTVGNEITVLNAPMAFSAQLSAALSVYMLTLFAIPTSTTFSIVGGVAGVGLVKGMQAVDKKMIMHIIKGWILTPLFSAVIAIVLLYIIKIALGNV